MSELAEVSLMLSEKVKFLLKCCKITWRWPLIHCFASSHLKDCSICHVHINVSWSLLVLTLSLGKMGCSYTLDFLKEFWPPNKAYLSCDMGAYAYRSAQNPVCYYLKDKQMLMPVPHLLASSKCRSTGIVFKGIIFLSVHCHVNSAFS